MVGRKNIVEGCSQKAHFKISFITKIRNHRSETFHETLTNSTMEESKNV